MDLKSGLRGQAHGTSDVTLQCPHAWTWLAPLAPPQVHHAVLHTGEEVAVKVGGARGVPHEEGRLARTLTVRKREVRKTHLYGRVMRVHCALGGADGRLHVGRLCES